ncbi:MAG: ABC transporter permease [Acidobacteriota bacterium]
MTGLDLLRLSLGALRGHRLRTGLSFLGVGIGVTSVVVLTSLGEGARRYVVDEFQALGTNLLIVLPGKIETTGALPVVGGVPNDLTLADVEAVRRRVPAVRRASPLVVGTARVQSGARSREVTVLGATSDLQHVRQLEVKLGRYLPSGDPDQAPRVCVIGSRVRSELFANSNPLGRLLRIGDERFRIVGVMAPRGVSVGFDFNDVVHIPVVRAMRLFNRPSVFRLLIEVGQHTELQAASQAVIGVLSERHGEEDVTVIAQDAVVSTFGQIMTVLTAVLAGIAAISLSVAGIGIMNVMLVSVSERTREIGLLKALGAEPAQVLGVFLSEAAVLSTVGGVAGLGLGYLCVAAARALYPAFPVEPPLWAVWSALAVSTGVGLVFGALPARRAASLDPVVALARRG